MYRTWNQNLKDNGYAVMQDFLTQEEVEGLKNACRSLIKDKDLMSHICCFSTHDQRQAKDEYFLKSATNISYFFEPEAIGKDGLPLYEPELCLNKIGHALHYLQPLFKEVTFSSAVKEIAKSMNFIDPCIVQSMYIFKSPKIGGCVNPHQDATFLLTEPSKVIGVWIALDDATIENGCLHFVPGSHKQGQPSKQFVRVPNPQPGEPLMSYIGNDSTYDENAFVAVPVKKGDCVLIDGLVIHKSEKNNSQHPRHAYTFHIIESFNTKWLPLNWLQPTDDKPFTRLFS